MIKQKQQHTTPFLPIILIIIIFFPEKAFTHTPTHQTNIIPQS
jgi:hypothetical protein